MSMNQSVGDRLGVMRIYKVSTYTMLVLVKELNYGYVLAHDQHDHTGFTTHYPASGWRGN